MREYRPGGRGGGASKSQPLRIPGQGFYLGERKIAIPTCRDEVAQVVEEFVLGGGGRVFTVGAVYAATVARGPLGLGRRL